MHKRLISAELEDVLPNSAFSACWCLCCFIVNFICLILFFPCTMSQLGQFKYGMIRNKVTGYIDLSKQYEPGRYWIGFWQEFVEFPSTLQTIEFADERPEAGVQHLSVLKSRDKDGKQIMLDISIQYKLHKDSIGLLYKDMLLEYENIFIAELRDQLAKAANLYAIEDAWQNYDSIVNLMRVRCEAVLQKRYADCWGLQLWGVTLTKRYESKLIQTQVRKQAQKTETAKKINAEVRAKTAVLLAEYKKNVTILRSGGEARSYNITQLAVATAQANFISAQAKALHIVKDRVCPGYARVLNTSSGNRTAYCDSSHAMTSKQLVAYQNQVLLKSLDATPFNFPMPAGLKRSSAINVEASRKIMKHDTDPGRRLKLKKRRLLHDNAADDGKDSRPQPLKLSNHGDQTALHTEPIQKLVDMDILGDQLGYNPLKSVALGFHEL